MTQFALVILPESSQGKWVVFSNICEILQYLSLVVLTAALPHILGKEYLDPYSFEKRHNAKFSGLDSKESNDSSSAGTLS
jgi:hypothetical protein